MIIKTNQINEPQQNELKQLEAQCKKIDGSVPNLYFHILSQHRAFPASFLYYQQNQLVGFLSVYFFYDEAAEVSVLVHPDFRKQSIARELLRTMLTLVQSQNCTKLIFSSPSKVNNNWLEALGYTYLHSEYHMKRDELTPVLDFNHSLTFRKASLKDLPVLCSIDELCFPQKQGNLSDRFDHLLDSREYQLILAYYNDLPIGKAHLRWQPNGATLSDIAITPQQQGKGFGSALIAHCINLALSEGKSLLNLDVETHNQRALNLYTQLGFSVHNACDYWSIEESRLSHFINPETEQN